MRIAIDCRLFSIPRAEKIFSVVPMVQSITAMASDHEFILLFDRQPPENLGYYSNVKTLVLKPSAKTAATRALWYDLRLPALLRKQKIGLFIGTAGYISLRTAVPQILVLNDAVSGETFPATTGWAASWYKRRLPAMLQKASMRMVSAKAHAAGFGPGAASLPFEVLPFFPFERMPHTISETEKQIIKEDLTAGAEFFYCEEGWNSTGEAVDLLLAFSAFKKRMQTGMKLVLSGKGPGGNDWKEKLAAYRYRDDIVIIPENTPANEKCRILTAAYALVHLPAVPKIRLPQRAFCLGVPVITAPYEVFREMAGEAVLYCTEAPGESLAQNLMRMYKDEKLRSECIIAGQLLAEKWDTETAASAFYQTALSLKG